MFLEENPKNENYTSLFSAIEKQRDNLFLLVAEILRTEISNYPIFVVSKEMIDLGKPFIVGAKHQSEWNINISLLEELAALGIVAPENLEQFKKVYKDPEQFFCILVVTAQKQEFVFMPRSKHSLN